MSVQTYPPAAGGSGAPTTADYLVGTANASLSAEIVAGTAPAGELGGTWAAPTVAATHSGSSHASKADLASPTFTGTPAAPTAAAGTGTTQLATTAYSLAAAPNSSYRVILDCSGSHTAGKVAGTYGMGQGDPLAVSGTGTLYPLNSIYIAAADYPTTAGATTKLRIRAQVHCNDVAPTGNYTVSLHPITRPAVSGGAGLVIYTIGAAVASSGVTVTTPAADSSNILAGADFAIPADGHYVIAVVTTATVAVSAHVHISAVVQLRNA